MLALIGRKLIFRDWFTATLIGFIAFSIFQHTALFAWCVHYIMIGGDRQKAHSLLCFEQNMPLGLKNLEFHKFVFREYFNEKNKTLILIMLKIHNFNRIDCIFIN